MVELFGDVLAEGIAHTSLVHSPARSFVRIGPNKIAHSALLGDLHSPVEFIETIQFIEGRRQSSMHAQELILDYCGERKIVKQICETFPCCRTTIFP